MTEIAVYEYHIREKEITSGNYPVEVGQYQSGLKEEEMNELLKAGVRMFRGFLLFILAMAFLLQSLRWAGARFVLTPADIKNYVAAKDIQKLHSIVQDLYDAPQGSRVFETAVEGIVDLDDHGSYIAGMINSSNELGSDHYPPTNRDSLLLNTIFFRCKKVKKKIPAWTEIRFGRRTDLFEIFDFIPPEGQAEVGGILAFRELLKGDIEVATKYLDTLDSIASGANPEVQKRLRDIASLQNGFKSFDQQILEARTKISEKLKRKMELAQIDEPDYFRLEAVVVAEVGDKRYEIRLPDGSHALLNTSTTNFGSRGFFTLMARSLGEREIRLKESLGSFKQMWKEFEEVDDETQKRLTLRKVEKDELTIEISNLQRRISSIRESMNLVFENNKKLYLDALDSIHTFQKELFGKHPSASGSVFLDPYFQPELIKEYFEGGNPFYLILLEKHDPDYFKKGIKVRDQFDRSYPPEYFIVKGGSIEAVKQAKIMGADFMREGKEYCEMAEKAGDLDLAETIRGGYR